MSGLMLKSLSLMVMSLCYKVVICETTLKKKGWAVSSVAHLCVCGPIGKLGHMGTPRNGRINMACVRPICVNMPQPLYLPRFMENHFCKFRGFRNISFVKLLSMREKEKGITILFACFAQRGICWICVL